MSPRPVDLSHCLQVECGPLDEHISIILNFKHHFLALPILENVVEELTVNSLELVLVEGSADLRTVVKRAKRLARDAKHRAVPVHDLLE